MGVHDTHAGPPIPAVVMNLFYTGLGIARSLGERGIPVIGLTTERGLYGNFSRYLKSVRCADSQKDPDTLLTQSLALAKGLGGRAVLFPTRDHDLVFLDRFREALEPHFLPVIPASEALENCLNKWKTYRLAVQEGVPTPRTWLVETVEDLQRIESELAYPCVMKPVAAHQWRKAGNWELVGGRKAISVMSRDELLAEYAAVARANQETLIQEIVPGGDDCLIVAACYMDRQTNFQAGFNVQKLVQTPVGFGTGCIVQSADRPELFDRTIRLLRAMKFNGIAEVEYKWDETDREYKLIEINPRPWDQHRLGAASGVDLVHLAYSDYAGLPKPAVQVRFVQRKWIAEDAFVLAALRLLWRRERGFRELLQQARGKKVYGIWSARDPLPFLVYLATLVSVLVRMGLQAIGRKSASISAGRQKAALRTIQ